MKINKLGNNETELFTESGLVVLFSYNTPVAALLPSGRFIRTDRKYSVTTTKHINRWVSDNCETVPQSKINELAGA